MSGPGRGVEFAAPPQEPAFFGFFASCRDDRSELGGTLSNDMAMASVISACELQSSVIRLGVEFPAEAQGQAQADHSPTC